MNWQPRASRDNLQARAALLGNIRAFFHAREILEVETPLLCSRGVTDPTLDSLLVQCATPHGKPGYLQTSPEYMMKRLLASGIGPVYQIAKAFRGGEAGGRHNPEFSLLEWYRPGLDHHQLMAEVTRLVHHCLGEQPVKSFSYRNLFRQFLDIDPFTASPAALEDLARRELDPGFVSTDRDIWLDLIMSHLIEPRLAGLGMCYIYDYPASQAALARIVHSGGVEVGQRFELYVNGMELANGYCELTDPVEQRARFIADNSRRREKGLAEQPLDELLLAAMEHGLPACSGVALGIDRLLMLVTGVTDIREVLAFDWSRC